jgi:hypothetical protein
LDNRITFKSNILNGICTYVHTVRQHISKSIFMFIRYLKSITQVFKCLLSTRKSWVSKKIFTLPFAPGILHQCLGWCRKNPWSECRESKTQVFSSKLLDLRFRHPTVELYRDRNILTVRQFFVLRIVFKKHSEIPYLPKLERVTVCIVPLI